MALLATCVLLSAAAAVSAQDPPRRGPAEVAVLLDTSGSLRAEDLDATRQLAREVLAGLPAVSRIAVLSFDDESRVLQAATADAEAIDRALGAATRAGRFTALHDALFDASRLLRDAQAERRAILLLTDGRDENSAVTVEDGLTVAQAEGIPVFAVGLGRIDEKSLRRIAKLTNGRYAPLGEVTGAEIAALIAGLPARPARTPEPGSAAEPGAAVATPAAAVGQLERIGAGALAALGFALALGALWLWRRQRTPPARSRAGAHRPPPLPPASAKVSADDLGHRDGATLMTRLPEVGAAGGTMVLKQVPMLRVKNGPGAGLMLELSDASAISLGRSPGNDIVLEDDAVSGQHARIRSEDGAFVVHDLQSTNGTFVNERRVAHHALVNGDVVRLGETQLEFVRFGR